MISFSLSETVIQSCKLFVEMNGSGVSVRLNKLEHIVGNTGYFGAGLVIHQIPGLFGLIVVQSNVFHQLQTLYFLNVNAVFC